MLATGRIRIWAMALPEADEHLHFRFRVPLWRVRGRTFLGMGADETTAIFCISEESADRIVVGHPEQASAERRRDVRRSFLGLQLHLDAFDDEYVKSLVREAWAAQAPQQLVKQFLDTR
jgi:hypothetical protein